MTSVRASPRFRFSSRRAFDCARARLTPLSSHLPFAAVNEDGRTFYSGDDPFWEAVNLHAWSTGDLEWYDPRMITTANGSLVITLTKQSEHDLDYMGGQVTSWNKFCFTGGRLESE